MSNGSIPNTSKRIAGCIGYPSYDYGTASCIKAISEVFVLNFNISEIKTVIKESINIFII